VRISSHSRKRSFRRLCKLDKSLRVLYGNFRKNPTIQHNSGFLEPTHKFAIRNITLPGSSTHPDYPQTAKISFFGSPVPVRKTKGAINRFLCGTMQFALSKPIPFRQTQNLLAPLDPLVPSFYSWHFSLRKIMTIHPNLHLGFGTNSNIQHPLYAPPIRLAYQRRIHQFSHPLARFFRQYVTRMTMPAKDLTCAGNLESFSRTFGRFSLFLHNCLL